MYLLLFQTWMLQELCVESTALRHRREGAALNKDTDLTENARRTSVLHADWLFV